MIATGIPPSGVIGFFIREPPSPSQGNTDTVSDAGLLACIIDTSLTQRNSRVYLSWYGPLPAGRTHK